MKLVIVGGCGSSGTTLLVHLLSRHRALASGPEMNFFNHKEVLSLEDLATHQSALFQRRRLSNGYKDEYRFLKSEKASLIDPELFYRWINNSNTLRELYGTFAEHMCKPHRAEVFVEKTPSNVYNFAALSKLFPNLPLIHQIRDGRDVVASLIGRGKTLFEAGSRWLYDTIAGLSAREAPSYLETRYEQLVKDPAGTLNIIFRHLNLSTEPDILRGPPDSSTGIYVEQWREMASGRSWQQTPNEPISTKSVGRYRQELTPDQLSTLYRIQLTKRAAERLNSPVRSFRQLLDFLEYKDFEMESWTLKRPLRITEWAYEMRDYHRRARRSWHHMRRLPPRLTTIVR